MGNKIPGRGRKLKAAPWLLVVFFLFGCLPFDDNKVTGIQNNPSPNHDSIIVSLDPGTVDQIYSMASGPGTVYAASASHGVRVTGDSGESWGLT